jgi:hypothetical protein
LRLGALFDDLDSLVRAGTKAPLPRMDDVLGLDHDALVVAAEAYRLRRVRRKAKRISTGSPAEGANSTT